MCTAQPARHGTPTRQDRPRDAGDETCDCAASPLVTVDEEGIIDLDGYAAALIADGRPTAPTPGHADDCPCCDVPDAVPCAADRVVGDHAYRDGRPIKHFGQQPGVPGGNQARHRRRTDAEHGALG
ncbi:hypothetical protein [Amycolatopsis sp. NPDC004079]|uniref:hypothetical protein n=1 Tax=Amycolatopsis sp. NPDC004079 TaxID=3154549 RepID=UPI0033B49A62